MRNKADLITKISLLKQEIDKCLDVRDQEGFYQLSFDLKVCQRYLQNRDKFFHH
ncbi:IDEAL domain-containing protein [Neobacillus niacini]|uniref:IDEAL domain-containing protein n=1 Tax=Neobacillus niacini TaxID=86668 RepID=UPI002FFE58D4